jgi:hypothetical protein
MEWGRKPSCTEDGDKLRQSPNGKISRPRLLVVCRVRMRREAVVVASWAAS